MRLCCCFTNINLLGLHELVCWNGSRQSCGTAAKWRAYGCQIALYADKLRKTFETNSILAEYWDLRHLHKRCTSASVRASAKNQWLDRRTNAIDRCNNWATNKKQQQSRQEKTANEQRGKSEREQHFTIWLRHPVIRLSSPFAPFSAGFWFDVVVVVVAGMTTSASRSLSRMSSEAK